jgi:hypothetical protein
MISFRVLQTKLTYRVYMYMKNYANLSGTGLALNAWGVLPVPEGFGTERINEGVLHVLKLV